MPAPYDLPGRVSCSPVRARLEEYLRNGDTTPYRADLDITSNCNFRCGHCGDRAAGLLHKGGFSRHDLDILIRDLDALRVREVCLIGGGEPTCSPHLSFALEAFKARAISCGLTTNGSGVAPKLAETLARTADWVRFSIDAASEETYARVHRPLGRVSLADIHRNLQRLAAQMPRKVGVSFLVLEANASEIALAAQQAKDLKAAHIRYRFANHSATGEVSIPPQTALIRDELERAAAFADDTFEVSVADSLTAALAGEPQTVACPFERCHAQALSTTITGTGDVYVCSKWRGEAWAWLGNLFRERLTEIWHGPRRKAVLQALKPAQTCRRIYCHGHLINAVVEKAETAHPQTPA